MPTNILEAYTQKCQEASRLLHYLSAFVADTELVPEDRPTAKDVAAVADLCSALREGIAAMGGDTADMD